MRVLLVDDSKTDRIKLRKPLEEAGWEVVEAACGQEALQKLAGTDAFNLVISDQNMPNMSGTALLKSLRELLGSPNQHVKVIFLTSDSSAEIRQDCSELGASAYVLKPVNGEALVQVAEKVVGAIK